MIGKTVRPARFRFSSMLSLNVAKGSATSRRKNSTKNTATALGPLRCIGFGSGLGKSHTAVIINTSNWDYVYLNPPRYLVANDKYNTVLMMVIFPHTNINIYKQTATMKYHRDDCNDNNSWCMRYN